MPAVIVPRPVCGVVKAQVRHPRDGQTELRISPRGVTWDLVFNPQPRTQNPRGAGELAAAGAGLAFGVEMVRRRRQERPP